MKIKKIITIVTILFITSAPFIFPATTIQAQESLPNLEAYYFHSSWGGEGKHLLRPVDVAVSSEGKIYIVNMEYNRLTILDQNGYIYNEIGGFGESDGEFNLPLSVAINDVGEIFVSDTWNRRMQKFDRAGNHLLTFGTFGVNEGQIYAPRGIAINDLGNLLVADANKIIVFNPNGEFLFEVGTQYGSPGTDDYEFDGVSDVAIDQEGNIYVVDSGNYRIQIFDRNFVYSDTIDITDEYDAQAYPRNAVVSSTGHLFVTVNAYVYIFDINDNYLKIGQWGDEGTALGQLGSPSGIFIEPLSGDVYVTEETNNRVSVFNSDGTIKTAFGTADLVNGYFYYPKDIVISNDEVFITDQQNHRVQVFNQDGTFIRKWGTYGSADGQFDGPWGIDADSSGNVYVADSNNNRIQKFDAAGNWLSSYDVSIHFPSDCFDENYQNPIICTPRGIAIDANDNIFVTIGSFQGHNLVYKFNSTITSLAASWKNGGGSIAVDGIGNVYTTWANQIFVYSNDGVLLNQWGEGPGPYKGLTGLEIDAYGDIYTTDAWYGVIRKYASDGTLLGTYGSLGNGPGQFSYGIEMAITQEGVIFAVDGENQRIQVLAPALPDPDPDSGLIQNGVFGEILQVNSENGVLVNTRTADPGLRFWAYGGALNVSRSTENTNEGTISLQLGSVANPATDQGITDAWAYQVFYVRPDWTQPVLKFNYNVFSNDQISKSNFIAEIQDGVGLNNLDIIVLDGYQGIDQIDTSDTATNLGWKSVAYNLTPYKGQHIRLVFTNRNLYPDSQGIWTFIEKVRIVNSQNFIFLPIITR